MIMLHLRFEGGTLLYPVCDLLRWVGGMFLVCFSFSRVSIVYLATLWTNLQHSFVQQEQQ